MEHIFTCHDNDFRIKFLVLMDRTISEDVQQVDIRAFNKTFATCSNKSAPTTSDVNTLPNMRTIHTSVVPARTFQKISCIEKFHNFEEE